MCPQVCPTCSNIFALQVWAIIAKEWQSIFHHLPSFEQDGQLRVLVNELLLIKVFVQLICRCREYSIWLVSLKSSSSANLIVDIKGIRQRRANLAECTFEFLVQCSQAECADMTCSVIAFRNGVVFHWFRTNPTRGIPSIQVLCFVLFCIFDLLRLLRGW